MEELLKSIVLVNPKRPLQLFNNWDINLFTLPICGGNKKDLLPYL
jgi:hypothetical protein